MAVAGGADIGAQEAARHMDAMYRYQRHVYDLTRKFYLFGRDRLLDLLPVETGTSVLEMGCGTGRNLIRLDKAKPGAILHGIDISAEMLGTAKRMAGGRHELKLTQASCDSLDPEAAFGVAQFDVIYFSYVLSMIPDWRPAVERAWELLAPGGTLGIVDFADQANVAPWRRFILLNWLKLFSVHPRPEIQRGLMCRQGVARIEDVMQGSAYIILLKKPG